MININPGPGRYDIRKKPGKGKPHIKMIGSRKLEKFNDFPSP